MGQWDWVRSDREYLRRQYRHITPLSWALRLVAAVVLLGGVVLSDDALWPFWVGLGLIGVTIVLDWRSKTVAERS